MTIKLLNPVSQIGRRLQMNGRAEEPVMGSISPIRNDRLLRLSAGDMACLRAEASGLRPSLVGIAKKAISWGTEDEAMLKPKNVRSGKCLSNIERTEERRRSRP